jgi:hypothetical protein
MIEKAQASMEVQKFLVGELKKDTENVNQEIADFKVAAAIWTAKQIVKVMRDRGFNLSFLHLAA